MSKHVGKNSSSPCKKVKSPSTWKCVASRAIVVVSMQNYLAQFGEWVTVIQGAIFVACVLLFRRGIVGKLGKAIGWSI